MELQKLGLGLDLVDHDRAVGARLVQDRARAMAVVATREERGPVR